VVLLADGGEGENRTRELWRPFYRRPWLGGGAKTSTEAYKTASAAVGQRRPLVRQPWRVAAWRVAIRRGRVGSSSA
jgi:hypothetical protein